MEQIHILFLTDVLYGTHGGAEGVLRNVVRLLPADRYRCSIATFATHSDLVAADLYACPVHRLPLRCVYDWNAVKAAARLYRLIRSERVAIVHTFFPVSDLFGGFIARMSRCPVVISSRRDMGFQRGRLHRLGYRAGTRLWDQVQAVGDRVRLRHIDEDGLPPDKVFTVYNGVDLNIIDSVPAADLRPFGIEPSSPVIVSAANIRRIKAADVLVETAALVCRRFPAARFLLMGGVQDEAFMAQVVALRERLGLKKKVIFGGSSPNIPSVLKACDVFYLPSRSEGLSNALLEAMACGLPCVATDVGGNSEAVDHGRSGFLVPVEQPAVAAQAITELLENCTAGREMGMRGHAIIESRFTAQLMIRRLVDLYEGLLALRGLSAEIPPAPTGWVSGTDAHVLRPEQR